MQNFSGALIVKTNPCVNNAPVNILLAFSNWQLVVYGSELPSVPAEF